MKTFLLTALIAATSWAQTNAFQVHVIEEREAKTGRFEVSLFPAAVQLNGAFTQHVGTETTTPATYGDTGTRFMGTFAAGLRLALGRHFTARLEVRDVVYSASVDQVNGCNERDLLLLSGRGFRDPGVPSSLGAQCRGFEGSEPNAALAHNLVRSPGSAVLHNAGLYVGAGFVF